MSALSKSKVLLCSVILVLGLTRASPGIQKLPAHQSVVDTTNHTHLIGTNLQIVLENLTNVLATQTFVTNHVADELTNYLPSVTISNQFYLQSNPSNFITHAEVGSSNLMSGASISNQFYLDSNPSNYITTGDVVNVQTLTYIYGVEPSYVDSDTVSISAGEGWNNGNYFYISNAVSYDPGLTGSTGINYIAIDHSLSTYPNGIVFDSFDSAPSYSPSKGGWYSNEDRVIGAIRHEGLTIYPYVLFSAGKGDQAEYILAGPSGNNTNMEIAVNWTPTGAWDTPNIAESSTLLPVNSSHVLLYVSSDAGGPGNCTSAGTTVEHAALGFTLHNAVPFSSAIINHSDTESLIQGWIELGPSLNVRIYGESDDDTDGNAHIAGWRINR